MRTKNSPVVISSKILLSVNVCNKYLLIDQATSSRSQLDASTTPPLLLNGNEFKASLLLSFEAFSDFYT